MPEPAFAWPVGLPPVESEMPLSGGMVCEIRRARLLDRREVVVKRSPYPADAEADGLTALAAAGVPVPQVLGFSGSVLVIEYVSGPPDWAGLGQAVARVHAKTR